MGELLLKVKDLSVAFNSNKVVNQLSFDLHQGETIAVVGESGSGKSITALSILGLLPFTGKITSGSIVYYPQKSAAIDLINYPNDLMHQIRGLKIAMIFQEPMTALNPVYTCGFQVTEVLKKHLKINHQAAIKKCLSLFEEVKLPDVTAIFDKYPHQISGGQKQRVMIAMALSCDPDILIADEPTTALDVTVQKNILELINTLKIQRALGVVFITHDLGVVYNLANQVLVMHKGDMVEKGAVEQIFSHPKKAYTKALLACKPPMQVRYHQLPTVADFVKMEEDHIPLKTYLAGIVQLPEIRKSNHRKIYQSTPILQVEDLKVYYPKQKNFIGNIKSYHQVVNGVSFDVYKGETLGLIGESGCGKTTIGKTIVGLQEKFAGNINFLGTNVATFSQSEELAFKRKVQMIFQDPYSSLNPRMAIGKAIAEPLKLHHPDWAADRIKQKVEYLLEKVGLLSIHFYRYPHEFSGGQRQRVAIARTLAMEPDLIICDESVSALDVSVQAQVLNLLNDLKKEFNLSYIFISHDLSVIKYMCDRMIVMNQSGKIEETGEADEIYANPQSTYTQELIHAIPHIAIV